VIVGEGPEREAIMAEALKLEIGHRVHLPGFVAKPAEATALFDLFALSSDSEQFPLSVVEAMASGSWRVLRWVTWPDGCRAGERAVHHPAG
jgi:glycosyltransferase involved in cell wall biosynthesis